MQGALESSIHFDVFFSFMLSTSFVLIAAVGLAVVAAHAGHASEDANACNISGKFCSLQLCNASAFSALSGPRIYQRRCPFCCTTTGQGDIRDCQCGKSLAGTLTYLRKPNRRPFRVLSNLASILQVYSCSKLGVRLVGPQVCGWANQVDAMHATCNKTRSSVAAV